MGEEFSAGDHRIVGVYGTPPQESQPKHPEAYGDSWLSRELVGSLSVLAGCSLPMRLGTSFSGSFFLALGIGNAIRWMRVRRSPSDGPR